MRRILNVAPKRTALTGSSNTNRNFYFTIQENFFDNFNNNNHLYQYNILNPNFKSLSIRNFCNENINSCWNCQKKITNKIPFFCNSCGLIQDPNKNFDFFKILSIKENFSLNSNELTSKFRQLQSMVHPDKYSNTSEREQTNSQEWSSLINKAYKTLRTPIERGEYLLKLKGIKMPKDNSSLNKKFLMEMMERNEEVEDANTSNDLNELLERVKNDMIIETTELNKEFDINNYQSVIFILVKMKYLTSLETSIKEKLEKLIK